MKRIAALIGISFIAASAGAQLVEFPLPHNRSPKKSNTGARTQAVADPTFLPFWDDFSTSDSVLRDSLWQFGNSVYLNNGIGIRPPSINIVSFDGTDSLGKPYNVNDVLAKGFADKLVSQPIRMDLVAPGLQNTVYISFYVQLQGRGEAPDPGDILKLSLKAQDGTWEDVFMLETNPTLDPDVFQQVIVPISDPKFFHDAFQFRFSNFARLSGSYDTWNIDYIYLNSGRSPSDLYFPDRTIATPLTSLFKNYYSMPVHHFLEDAASNLVHPTLDLNNLKQFGTPGGTQPYNYTTQATIASRINGVTTPTVVNLNTVFPGTDLIGQQFQTVVLDKIPDASDFDVLADSIHIAFKYEMNTSDNLPILAGDYDPAIYSPIDFRYSDTLTANYVLSSYYAYDDGAAEYVAGLNQAGSFLAYLFIMNTTAPDTLVYVDIYFPEFGDNTSQSLQLQVRQMLTDNTSSVTYQQNIVVDRKTMNRFSRYPLTVPVPVQGSFYIGWKQLTNVSIPIGLDKNTDNGDKVWYNTNGLWVQNTTVSGSLMVRPGFGKGQSVVTQLEMQQTGADIFPNPARGGCFVKGHPEALEVYDLTGRKIPVDQERWGDNTRITFSPSVAGLVLVRYTRDGQVRTQKLMVQAE